MKGYLQYSDSCYEVQIGNNFAFDYDIFNSRFGSGQFSK
jgi:hypothetical protein